MEQKAVTNRERINNILNFKPADRMPEIELMEWWDKTITRWSGEGLPETTWPFLNIVPYWGLDLHRQFWVVSSSPELGSHKIKEINAYVRTQEDYDRIRPFIFPEDAVLDNWIEDELLEIKASHDAGDIAVWMTLYGYFWWPRVLLGIEPHLYSFFEQPELYHRMCKDQMEFQLRIIEEFCSVLKPDFVSIAEDMSYNQGPMISEKMFDEFIAPYYAEIIPALHKHGMKVLVDTDGDVTMLVPWLLKSGVDGLLPMERRAGVDVCRLRELYPEMLMIGGFDKTVMQKGEEAMRKEFEYLVPAMKSGGFIPCIDHQTPPDVSMDNYRIYRKLQEEFCGKYHP